MQKPRNLLKRLFFVYDVFDPNGEQSDEVTISREHDDYLGYSCVVGIFLTKLEARQFALEYSNEKLRRKIDASN